MEKRYSIAFLTSVDPTNKLKLSGSPYYIMNALQTYVGDVTVLGPVKFNDSLFYNYLERFFKLFPRPYNLNHSYIVSFFFAKIFQRKLKAKHFDLIFAPRSSTQIALLNTQIPIVYYTDTTFKSMYNYYSWFSNFARISEIEGNSIEKRVIQKSIKVIVSSQWAADSVIKDYMAPDKKVHIVPFGPNVDFIPSKDEIFNKKSNEICRLLFIGVEWERKGGKIAYDAFLKLKKMGIRSELTILGVEPPELAQNEDVTIIPFLDKNNASESAKFNELLLENHFLLLPTREECFGVVFCEASAYGLPSLSTYTGGVPSAIVNDKNGFLFSLNDGGEEYAIKIAEYFLDYENSYLKLSERSRQYYEEKLNWESFGNSVLNVINDFLSTKNIKHD